MIIHVIYKQDGFECMFLQFIPRLLKNEIRACCINVCCCILGGRFCQVHEGPLKPRSHTPSSPCGPPRETVGRHQGHGEPTFPNSLKLWHLHTGSQVRPCHVLCTLWVHLQFVFAFFYWFNFCSKNQIDNIFYMYCSHKYSCDCSYQLILSIISQCSLVSWL